MGFFERLFGQESRDSELNKKELPWIPLTKIDQLDEISQRSFEKPQLIYKHSTTCGISSMVLNMFTKGYILSDDQADLFFLDIHQSRNISNEIASRYQVRHESPQLLFIKDGRVAVHTSHGAIAELNLDSYL